MLKNDSQWLVCTHKNCKNSPLINQHLGHVVTGDLRIIPNKRLRKLFLKGPNFREPCTINWNKSKIEIEKGLQETVIQFSKIKKNILQEQLIPWKQKVLEKVDEKIRKLKQRITPKKTNPILKDLELKHTLESFQTKICNCSHRQGIK